MSENKLSHHVLWTPWQGPGLEHVRLIDQPDGIVADSMLIGFEDGKPFRLRYRVACTADWHVRRSTVACLNGDERTLTLLADGEGHWTTEQGESLPLLDGCLDIDITATPFTNTLPIRRLRLQTGESAEIVVAYIQAPALQLTVDRQRYTCLASDATGGRYRFEALASGFTAELAVDHLGLVMDYPELFKRIHVTNSPINRGA